MKNRYKYKGQYQTKEIVQELILTLFAGTPKIKREYVRKAVLEFHRSQGGLLKNADTTPYTTTALRELERKGFAKQLKPRYWSILSIYDYDLEL